MIGQRPDLAREPGTAAQEADIESAIIDWLNTHRALAIYAVPAAAFAEACLGIGLFFSSFILVATCSYLHAAEIATLGQMLPLAFAGALLGDHSGFYVGRWIGPRLHGAAFGRRHAARIAKADDMVVRWGWGAILVGRFVPAIRSIIPALTGISGFGRLRYTLFDTLACLLWVSGLALILFGVDAFLF
jgi:membrane-associated protein